MAVARRFLIASALTRLIRKERGSERIIEGHFAPQSERQSHIRVERGQSYLVLTSLNGEVIAAEDWTEVPRSHAEALLEVCPGTVIFERSRLRMRHHEALIDRFITPGHLDLVSVEFATQADADAFLPPVWFGSEVTGDETYSNRMIAVAGRPRVTEAPLSNAALETALDLLESGSEDNAYGQHDRPAERATEDSAFDRLRRLAVRRPASPLPAAPASPAETRQEEEAVARLKPRRPVVQKTPTPVDEAEDRLAGVIQGLSEALAQTAEKDERFGS